MIKDGKTRVAIGEQVRLSKLNAQQMVVSFWLRFDMSIGRKC